MTPLLKYTLRAILLLFLQYLLSTRLPLGGLITPYIYFVFVLWLPFTISRIQLLFVAAIYGLAMGYLVFAPGIHAAVCVLIAYLRPFVIQLLLPREVKDMNYTEPSIKSMGFAPYSTYIVILTVIHFSYLILLQLLSAGNLWYFIQKLLYSTIVSLVLIVITDTLLGRKSKTRASLN